MATIKPFPGFYYSTESGVLEELTCPAYDVVSQQEREKLLETNPYNFIQLEQPQGENAYQQANELLSKWIADEVLVQDDAPAYYVYEAEYHVSEQIYRLRGFLCLLQLPEDDKTVLTHENTFDKAKADRLSLLQATNANTSSIYCLYDDPAQTLEQDLEAVFQTEPLRSSRIDGTTHKLWSVQEEDLIQKITACIADKQLYIADGHHRYQAALNYRALLSQEGELPPEHPANYTMTLLCERHCTGLVALPTHRILKDIPNFDSEALCQAAEEYFEITACNSLTQARAQMFELRRQNKNAFLLYADNEYHLFVLKDSVEIRSLIPELKNSSDAFCHLDIVVLHSILLNKLLSLTDQQITYTRSAKEACAQVDLGEACAAILLSATRVSELCAVAEAGEKMPQKSTYFYPKPLSGLVLRKEKPPVL